MTVRHLEILLCTSKQRNVCKFFTAKPKCNHMPLGAYTNSPPLVSPFLLTLNQSPKDIAGSDITCML